MYTAGDNKYRDPNVLAAKWREDSTDSEFVSRSGRGGGGEGARE